MSAVTDPSFEGKSDLRLPTFLRFPDLKRLGIVNNYTTLLRWIASGDFPPGRMLGPNTRVWTLQEVEAWLASRPAGKVGA